jgi:hypothetical protein
MRIGLIADTHIPVARRALPPGVMRRFAELNLIRHAGDIFIAEVLEALGQVAPVHAVYGNGDVGLALPETHVILVEDLSIGLVHKRSWLTAPERLFGRRLRCVVTAIRIYQWGRGGRAPGAEESVRSKLTMRRARRVAGALALLALLVSPIRAQPGGWDGLFVLSSDGSVWAILGGTRRPLQLTAIDDDALAQFTEGDPIVSVDQLATASAPPPAPSPAPTSPAARLVGQSATLCRDNVPLSVSVEQAEWSKSAAGVIARGMWVLTVVQATNTGAKPGYLNWSAVLRDERGRVFQMASMFELPVQALAERYGAGDQYTEIPPGASARILLAFGVARDVRSLELAPTNWSCR